MLISNLQNIHWMIGVQKNMQGQFTFFSSISFFADEN